MVYDRIIKGKTVLLRSIEESDAEETFKLRNDPDKSKFVNKSSGTIEGQRTFIIQQRQKPNDYLFVIEDLFGKTIGMKGVYNYDPELKTVETGRFMSYGTPVQNTEALLISFDFAFNILKCNEINMSALEKNTIMRSMQDNFGVAVTHKEYDINFNDFHVYSVLNKAMYLEKRNRIIKIIDRFSRL